MNSQYCFYGRLSEKFPSQFIVDVIEDCTLACVACPHSEFKKSEHYSGARLDPMLNEKLVKEVEKYGKNITQYIRYTANGEPLLHPQIFEMLEYAVQYSGAIVALTTNGTILNAKRAERIITAGVHVVDISIDAFSPKTYSDLRVGGNLEITRRNVVYLIEMVKEKSSKTRVVVSFVESDLNVSETSDFESFWKENGADSVVIRRLHTHSGAKNELAIEKRKILDNAKRRPCLYPWERMVLNARGELSYCPSDWVHGSVVTDYRKSSIYDLWHGEFYKSLRKSHLDNIFKDFPFCAQCPDWEATRWPEEGRSYANMIEDFMEQNNQ